MAELNEGFLDKLKKAINTSTATGKARAAGDWFREKVNSVELAGIFLVVGSVLIASLLI